MNPIDLYLIQNVVVIWVTVSAIDVLPFTCNISSGYTYLKHSVVYEPQKDEVVPLIISAACHTVSIQLTFILNLPTKQKV